jgi:uroporphyrinogen III methyltransferase/synthase
VGKEANDHSVPQDQIGDLLIDRVRAGKRVVRLKGGDPFVFGRGGEEAEVLADAGLAFEVIPGVTSAVAVPAYAGIPVTHRAAASSFTVVTGHEDDAKPESTIDWSRVAYGADTLVILMGLRALPELSKRLVEEGRSPDTPAASIQSGTTSRQRVVTGTLATLPDLVTEAGLESPVLTVVGDVVNWRSRLAWFENRPLFGKSILVTRTRQQASALVERLRAEGAEPLEFPTIELAKIPADRVEKAVVKLADGAYDWVIFTSAHGVREFFRHLYAASLDARAFVGADIAVIGAETAQALTRYGIRPDVIPERFVAESLLEALADRDIDGGRVLLARAQGARDLLPKSLREKGAEVDDVPLYVSRRPAHPDPAVLRQLEEHRVDIAIFSSSSTVTGCLEMLEGRTDLLDDVFIACIGPITAQTAADAGLDVGLVSEVQTIDGVLDALRERMQPEREGAGTNA